MDRALSFDRIPGAPWRPVEILAVLLGLMTAPPLAAAYVAWKLWRAVRRQAADRGASLGTSTQEASGRHAPEEREYAEILRELRRPRDPAEFQRFARRRPASA